MDKKMKKYDLHMHSYYSPCSRNKPEEILKAAKRAGLNGIAITDHDSISCYLVLKKLNKDKNFEIICGEEIHTQHGDIIALYLKKEIKSRDFFMAVKEVHSQGGIVIIPHPHRQVYWHKFKYPLSKLKGKIDAIETFNSRNTNKANRKAIAEAEKNGFAQTGSSDGHLIFDIGKGYTMFPANMTLKEAIRNKKTVPGGNNNFGTISALVSAFYKRILTPLFGMRTDKYDQNEVLRQKNKSNLKDKKRKYQVLNAGKLKK
ncbi:MAG TPA: PHP domain-containing protein [Alphaproteobacteria bacterium]|nr:PHP domain-containing protein [Alphaproteobacteria bacterium]